MENTYESLATVAVVRELYDTGKDIYDVLAEYLKLIIATEKLKTFSCAEITDKINKNNAFELNEGVVKTALKRLPLAKEHGLYKVAGELNNEKQIAIFDEQIQQNNALLESLFQFISSETGSKLSSAKKSELQKQFYNFLLNKDTADEYTMMIGKYIMKVSVDQTYMSTINRIKEGALIYEGICYSPNLNELGSWKTELNIYLETEVLFFMAGYDGEIQQTLYNQLLIFIREINTADRTGKKYINLYYTEDVQAEIDAYFRAAEKIFESGGTADPSKSAMIHILDGVHSKSDIQEKRVRFYKTLESQGIKLLEYAFFSDENKAYNRVNDSVYQENIKTIRSDKGDEYIKKCTDRINQIEILRKNINLGLQYVKHILLTANGTILKCAYSKNVYVAGEVPKATTLEFLVDRFWFKLNKGFGKGEVPKTVDIVTRAQLVLSTLTNSKVSKSYEEMKQRYEDGEISQTEVACIIAELRKRAKTPDDISADELDADIQFLNDFDINQEIERIKREELARKRDQERIADLESTISQMQEQQIQTEESQKIKEIEYKAHIEELEKECDRHRQENGELNSRIDGMTKEIELKKSRIRRKWRMVIFVVCLLAAAAVLFLACSLIFRIDKSVSGLISIVLTALIGFVSPVKRMWKKYVMQQADM